MPMKRLFLLCAAPLFVVSAQAQQAVPPPLAHDHSLAFTAHEATWMHLDLSPDGKTIVFDLLGDIYALDARGGTARPLLTGPAFERNPVFSPDGTQIAFISDRSGVTNLWVAKADGSDPRQLSHDTSLMLYASPAWSADGRQVFVSRAVHAVLAFELMQYPVAGGAGTTVVKAMPNNEGWDDRINALDAVLSPDGRYAYYATKRGTTWSKGDVPNWSIARRDLAAGTDEAVLTPLGGALDPRLSHDGRLLAYATRENGRTALRLRDLTSGADRRIAYPLDRDGQDGGYYDGLLPSYVFAPDDRSIVLSLDGGIRRLDLATSAMTPIAFEAPVKLDLATGTRVRQHEETGPVRPRVIQAPRLSPDGRRVAFTALGALYVQDVAAGTAPRQLVAADAFQPAWSPDGHTLAFVRWSPQGGGVETIAATGGTPRRLTTIDAFYTEPVFTPDGRSVVAMRASQYDRLHAMTELSPDRPTDIVLLPAGGGAARTITHVTSGRSPHFTTDGRLWFYSASGLRSLDLANGTPRDEVALVARAMGQYINGPRPVQDAEISPDGTHILVRAASQLYLVDTPARSGDKPATVNVSAGGARVRLTRDGADFLGWSSNGTTITWSVGSTFRQAAVADADKGGTGAAEAMARSVSLAVEVPRDTPHGVLVLRGATMLPMEGRERIEHADIVIRDNRILGVGPTGQVAIPAGATIRDLSGRFIVPGFVDTHAHFFGVRRNVQERGYYEFPVNLAYGVTASLEVQAFTPDIFTYEDMIDAGMMPGPRLWSTGPGVFVNSEIDSKQAALDVLRRYRDHYRTRNIKAYMVGDRAARQYIVQAAQELGMMPTTEGASDLVLGLTHAIDGFSGNEHALPVSPLRDDVVRLFAASHIAYTPTLSVLYGAGPALNDYIIHKRPQDDPRLQAFTPPAVIANKLRNRHWEVDSAKGNALFAADATRLQRAGVLVGIGSHGELQGLGYHWEMQALAAGGATPMEVLRAATIDGATIVGHADDIGSLVPGKFADMVILARDPTADIVNTEAIVSVVKNGRVYDAMTLASDWPDMRPAPTPWFARERATPGDASPGQ